MDNYIEPGTDWYAMNLSSNLQDISNNNPSGRMVVSVLEYLQRGRATYHGKDKIKEQEFDTFIVQIEKDKNWRKNVKLKKDLEDFLTDKFNGFIEKHKGDIDAEAFYKAQLDTLMDNINNE